MNIIQLARGFVYKDKSDILVNGLSLRNPRPPSREIWPEGRSFGKIFDNDLESSTIFTDSYIENGIYKPAIGIVRITDELFSQGLNIMGVRNGRAEIWNTQIQPLSSLTEMSIWPEFIITSLCLMPDFLPKFNPQIGFPDENGKYIFTTWESFKISLENSLANDSRRR